jgi:hypothetical protein
MKKYCLYIIFFLFSTNIIARNEKAFPDSVQIQLKGILISRSDSLPIPYANIFNLRTRQGTITDAKGLFKIQVLSTDSLRISALGFMRELITIPKNQDSIFVVLVRPVRYAINEVVVKGESPVNLGELGTGKPVDISPELRGDAFNKKPHWTQFRYHPVSFLHYYFSKKEKEKRKVRKLMELEKDWEALSKLYNKETVEKITGLTGEKVDNFMVWLNSKSLLNSHSTEYDIRYIILSQHKIYRIEVENSIKKD